MEHLYLSGRQNDGSSFMEKLMRTLSSVRIDANHELFENGLTSVEDCHSLKRVLTYGTFDLLHYGHIRLLQQASKLGDYLIVGLSTDEFNALKGKNSFYSYDVRREMLEALRYVDLVIPENNWDQKPNDIKMYHADIVCMGGDWAGDPRFESLRDICDVVYLNRTPGISTTEVKDRLAQ